MATEAQINANRANAKKSTGPKTEEGKAKSKMNRLSHGFASCLRFLPEEDPEEFYALLSDFTLEYQPETPTEKVLVEKMAQHQWITLRAWRYQGDLLSSISRFEQCTFHLPLLIRYQTTAERAFHKAHDELLKAQKQRQKSEIGFESQTAPEPPAETETETEIPPVEFEKPAPPAPDEEFFITYKQELNALMNTPAGGWKGDYLRHLPKE